MQKLCVILALSASLFTNNALAKDTIKLNRYTETTNIDTKDYVWNVSASMDMDTETITASLDNPHPILTAYNERALAIAHNITKSSVENFLIYNTDLERDEIDTLMASQTKIELDLPITFTTQIIRKPSFKRNISRIRPYQLRQAQRFACPSLPANTDPLTIVREKRTAFLNYRLILNGQGKLQSYTLVNQQANGKYFDRYLRKNLRKGMQVTIPINKDAVLVPKFIVKQTIAIPYSTKIIS
ncbi:MAG: hypothetical protein CSA42_02575 [Gammaproteobacteria bacterium]|nr:MAG: hypothetical protein CSA42_02575 [Gammaproteobacteria bacterium]